MNLSREIKKKNKIILRSLKRSSSLSRNISGMSQANHRPQIFEIISVFKRFTKTTHLLIQLSVVLRSTGF